MVTLLYVKGLAMATTSLKLSEELKERVAKLAEASGKSAHAFMVDAIATEAQRIEEDQAFLARAEASLKHYKETGISYAAEDVHAYIYAKLKGEPLPALIPVRDKK